MSTITAISSPIGAGGIGIVRVSGEDALDIASAIFHISGKATAFEPLKMTFGTFQAEDFCDKGYAVYFPAGRAFTGEDTVEFYLHGGVRIMQGALDTIISHGAVLAGKGEFTKRAYLSGRIALADAEGVIDMINAESSAGLRAAYRLMDGEVSKKINGILDSLLNLISSLEASLDYPDEMQDELLPIVPVELAKILSEIETLIASAKSGHMAKHGITAVLAGKTNSGKSSLMNAMLKRERAIVTPIAGTTRDTVSESFECDGVKINLIDTAGIRESADEIENEGIARAKQAFQSADVILHVIDTTDKSDRDFGASFLDGIEVGARVFTILNKCDQTSFACPRRADMFAVSAKTGENVEHLTRSIASLFTCGELEGGEIITSERHISALNQAKLALKSAFAAIDETIDCTLIDMRFAYDALGEITGRTATEDVVA
ncbi:MAG: tRNA uridine-5-carboxymethylaminomethyl(34) synthesis GTPase MnmE, partial [Clostridia bacterium]